MAQSAAGIIPGANPASQGRVTISIPTNPTKIEIILILVRRSPSRKGAASIPTMVLKTQMQKVERMVLK